MTRPLLFVFLLALLLGPAPARAQTDAATAELLLKKSGLWEQLAHIAPQVLAGFSAAAAQGGTAPSAGESERLDQTVRRAYAPAGLRASALAVVGKGLLPQHVAALRGWFDSAAGKRITQLEEAASASTSDPDAVMQEGAALLAAAPAGRRLALERLTELARAAEAMTGITINTALAVHAGMARAAPGQAAVGREDLRRALEEQRPRMLQTYAGMALAHSGKVYETLDDQELARYLAFLETPAGQHFTDICLRALDSALAQAAEQLGEGLAGTRDGANT